MNEHNLTLLAWFHDIQKCRLEGERKALHWEELAIAEEDPTLEEVYRKMMLFHKTQTDDALLEYLTAKRDINRSALH